MAECSAFERLISALREQHERDLAAARSPGSAAEFPNAVSAQRPSDGPEVCPEPPNLYWASPPGALEHWPADSTDVHRPAAATRPASSTPQRELPPQEASHSQALEPVSQVAEILSPVVPNGAASGDDDEDEVVLKTIGRSALSRMGTMMFGKASSKSSSKRSSLHARLHEMKTHKAFREHEKSKSKRNLIDSIALRDRTEEDGLQHSLLYNVVHSTLFEQGAACLLVLNGIFIGVQMEWAFNSTTPGWMTVIDIIFCIGFFIELVLRLVGNGPRRFFFSGKDRAWNWFDTVIVLLSSFDTVVSAVSAQDQGSSVLSNISVMRVIRVVRVVRVLRIIRVLKFFRDLRLLTLAIASTIKTASFALMLIMLLIYMFAISIVQFVATYIQEQKARDPGYDMSDSNDLISYFGSIGTACISLFLVGMGGAEHKLMLDPLWKVGALPVATLLFFIGLMGLCILNVMIGIFCNSAVETAKHDRENVIQTQLEARKQFIDTLHQLFRAWDDSGDGKCSFDEFQTHILDDDTQALLGALEIESRDAITLFELLDQDDNGDVDLDEFITGCICLRGNAKAVHMEKITSQCKKLQSRLSTLEEKIDGIKSLAEAQRH
eukprot:TRINITY_DN11099_c0_g1_i1.p1 TRINITY_DN11099_c0_g1~~TRINITY_DN11099_c0_g1_i1.p1  ORF type:complete len:607 (-),score=111.94 TRINITY_DN11099_c0_g1_i1:125-1945(-)